MPDLHPEPISIPRLDAFQRRHKILGFPLAVFYKYFEDTGPYLAALLTYYGFIAVFPLLLILSTVLGIVLVNDASLRKEILDTAVTQFPVVGDQLGNPRKLSGGRTGLIIGIVGSLYGGMGVANALQHTMNTAWSVPRNSRRNIFQARWRSLQLLGIAGLGLLATTAVSIVAGTDLSSGAESRWLLAVGGTAVSAVLFIAMFRMATTRRLSIREVAPGAIVAAIGWHLLQAFGVVYVDHVVRNASTTNGVFALVLGLIAFIFIGSIIFVFCVEINVVRVDKLYPRALLTPFTDKVVLTPGDERSYQRHAQAQRHKGFQQIQVLFDRRPPEGRGTGTDDEDADG